MIKQNASLEIPIVIVGNKKDISEEERKVTSEEAREFTRKELGDSDLYFEISAKTGDGVTEMFDTILSKAFDHHFALIGIRGASERETRMSFHLDPEKHSVEVINSSHSKQGGKKRKKRRCRCQ